MVRSPRDADCANKQQSLRSCERLHAKDQHPIDAVRGFSLLAAESSGKQSKRLWMVLFLQSQTDAFFTTPAAASERETGGRPGRGAADQQAPTDLHHETGNLERPHMNKADLTPDRCQLGCRAESQIRSRPPDQERSQAELAATPQLGISFY